MNIKYEKTKLKTLCWSIEDTISLFWVSSFIEEFYDYEDFDLIQETTLKVIEKLLEEGVVIAGDLLDDNSFIPWNKKTPEIISKIKTKWDSLNRELYPHEIVWLEVTKKGEEEFEYLKTIPEVAEVDPFYLDDN
jgi:hypothetical protein